jgi:SAM-dependent methyltransferase
MTLISKIKWRLKKYDFRYFAGKLGYVVQPKGLGYFKAEEIISKAKEAGQSICSYLENNNIGGVGKRRDEIISTLKAKNVFDNVSSVLEIGAGTGMYLEKTVEIAAPQEYFVYETAKDWTDYLSSLTFDKTKIFCEKADGKSLVQTKSNSIDLVLSHAVFVYIPALSTVRYIQESARVCKPGGLVVFDCFTNEIFQLDTCELWLHDNYGYTFPVILNEGLILQTATASGLKLQGTFDVKYHASSTRYFIFKKSV